MWINYYALKEKSRGEPFRSSAPGRSCVVEGERTMDKVFDLHSADWTSRPSVPAWSPWHSSKNFVQYGNSLQRNKVLCGSGQPMIAPERPLYDFENTGIKDALRPLILKDNATRLSSRCKT
jgi:hypothetical protein